MSEERFDHLSPAVRDKIAEHFASRDQCRPVEIAGQTIRVRGEQEMSDAAKDALAEVIAAAVSGTDRTEQP